MRSRDNTPTLTLGVLGGLRLASPDVDVDGLSNSERMDSLLEDLSSKSIFVGLNHVLRKAPGGRENSWTDGLPSAAAAWRHMPEVACELSEPSAGFVLHVFDDGVLFERLDFATGMALGDGRYVPIQGVAEALPLRVAVPQFPTDAEALACEGDGKTRDGKPERQITVRFPTASPVRAFDYAVTVRYSEADLLKVAVQKRVFSYGLFRPVDDATAFCAFGVGELPWDVALDFEIVPLSAFGGAGAPLHATGYVESPEARAKRLRKERKAAVEKTVRS